jgi:hypothetical protein
MKKQTPRVRKKKVKYTKAQKERHIANQAIKDLVCVYVYSGKDSTTKLVNIKTMSIVKATPLIDSATKWYPHKWVVSIALLIREKNMKIKAPSEEVSARDASGNAAAVMFESLSPTLDTWHKQMIRSNPAPECLVNVGWIGNPHGYEIDPATELALYELVGGFRDYIAPWEVEAKETAGYDVQVMS